MIRMKTLTIVIILLASTIVAVELTSLIPQAEADGDIILLSHTIFQDEGLPPFAFGQGDYHVAGEVQNVGTQALHFNVTAQFYDSNNQTVGTAFLSDTLADQAPSYLHVLLPSKKSPFDLPLSRFDEVTGDFRLVDHYSLTVTSSTANLYQSGFEILSQSSHEAAGTIFIEGEIKNIGTEYIDGFNVFATFYNQTGEVVAVASEGGGYTGGNGFPPNQTTYFSVDIEDFREGGRLERISRYELTVEGYDYSLWTADGQLIDPEIVYVLGALPDEEEETLVQPENPPIILYAAIIAIVAVLLITTFLLLRKRNKGSRNPVAAG